MTEYHVAPGEPPFRNRLIHAVSPYLQQHAENPVDWYAWGEEAFARARQEDKPVLVSIGYSSCHWCHVMAHESFEDPDIGRVQNEHFINIKVDREERPDVDSIYMTALQAMTGHGGWPLNVFLLPDGTPFYGGTYFPPDTKAARYRTASWRQVLLSIAEAYRSRRADLQNTSRQLLDHITRINTTLNADDSGLPPYPEVLDAAYNGIVQRFDPDEGGFGDAPKFPQPMTLEFVLRSHLRNGDAEALRMLSFTLQKMARGGIYDQLGGGFHRYSVDAYWLVPHFEKMLYDNALLARMYAEMYQVTGDAFFQGVAEETLDYLQREMLHPDGGFYSTQDADSLTPSGHMEEGYFFTWTPDEIREVLGEDATLFAGIFNVTRHGNFEGRNILHLPRSLEEVARVTGSSSERLREVMARGRSKLFAAREQRERPFRDEKIIMAWNGMALRAFAVAAAAFDSAEYLDVARQNADFLLRELRRPEDGRLLRLWKDGQAQGMAYLEDYALLADGLLALYSVDGSPRWLRECIACTESMLQLFWDAGLGGFYDTAADQEQLITRPRDVSDNATPSGSSVAAELLLRLAALTGNDVYRARAEQVIAGVGPLLSRFGIGFGRMLCAVDLAAARIKEVAVVGEAAAPGTRAMLDRLLRPYRPHIVLAQLRPGDKESPELTPLLKDREMLNGQPTAYVCENFTCRLPTSDLMELERLLEQ